MSLDKLCDLYIEHKYYNDLNSHRLKMQLVPSIESGSLIRKKHIVVKNKKNLFSIYGDVYTKSANGEDKKLKSRFKLSFALSVNDPYFLQASDLPLFAKKDLGGPEITLAQGNPKRVYYFHNNRKALLNSKAFLSSGQQLDSKDLVYLYPLTFAKEGLKELHNLRLLPNIGYNEDDKMDEAYSFYTIVDPANAAHKNRVFEADFSPFGSGVYTFEYSHAQDNALKSEITSFYLNNQFYALRPFAVIDLFFYKDINDNFKVLNKNFYISIPARKSYWRYYIISKYNRYKDLKISSDPGNLFPEEGVPKIMKNAESAIVFESSSKLEFKQVMERSCGLIGTHVETLGIPSSDDDNQDNNGNNDHERFLPDKPFQQLPTPKVENLVLEKLNAGTKNEKIEFYSDLFIYI